MMEWKQRKPTAAARNAEQPACCGSRQRGAPWGGAGWSWPAQRHLDSLTAQGIALCPKSEHRATAGMNTVRLMHQRILQACHNAGCTTGYVCEEDLQQVLQHGSVAWPGVEVDAGSWARFVAPHVGPTRPLMALLQEGHPDDVYLCVACVDKDKEALRILQQRYATQWPSLLSKLGLEPHHAADVVQAVWEKLLVPREGSTPGLTRYSGRGSLHSFLTVVVTNEGLNTLRRLGRVREQPLSDDPEKLSADISPQWASIKEQYSDQFARVFRACMEQLDVKHRELLRYHYVDGLTIDQIAPLYGVHRATVARWLVAVRERLHQGIRHGLMERLQVQPEEFDSFMRLIRSQLQVSIREHLDGLSS